MYPGRSGRNIFYITKLHYKITIARPLAAISFKFPQLNYYRLSAKINAMLQRYAIAGSIFFAINSSSYRFTDGQGRSHGFRLGGDQTQKAPDPGPKTAPNGQIDLSCGLHDRGGSATQKFFLNVRTPAKGACTLPKGACTPAKGACAPAKGACAPASKLHGGTSLQFRGRQHAKNTKWGFVSNSPPPPR